MSDFPERILHVDDDETQRDIVTAVFKGHKETTLESCCCGEKALSRLAELQPQLILLDLKMPKIDGPETLDKLRKTEGFAETPVIFLTGVTEIKMQEDYKKLGVAGVIHKPIDQKMLVENIRILWKDHTDNQGHLRK